MRWTSTFAAAAAFLLMASTSVQAGPIVFKMVTDDVLAGRATLTGSIINTLLTGDTFAIPAISSTGGLTKNWFAFISITKTGTGFTLEVEGRHISAPAPHKDLNENVPGPPLDIQSYTDIVGSGAGPGAKLDRIISQEHLAGTHRDFMVTHLADLNPSGPGVIGAGTLSAGEIQMSIDFSHEKPIPVPLPPALIPGAIGLLGVAWMHFRKHRIE